MEPEVEDIPTRKARNKLLKGVKEKERVSGKEYVPIQEPKQTVEVIAKARPSRDELETVEDKTSTKTPNFSFCGII